MIQFSTISSENFFSWISSQKKLYPTASGGILTIVKILASYSMLWKIYGIQLDENMTLNFMENNLN